MTNLSIADARAQAMERYNAQLPGQHTTVDYQTDNANGSNVFAQVDADGKSFAYYVANNTKLADNVAISQGSAQLRQQMAATPMSQRHNLSTTVTGAGNDQWTLTLTPSGQMTQKMTAQPQSSGGGGFLGGLFGAIGDAIGDVVGVAGDVVNTAANVVGDAAKTVAPIANTLAPFIPAVAPVAAAADVVNGLESGNPLSALGQVADGLGGGQVVSDLTDAVSTAKTVASGGTSWQSIIGDLNLAGQVLPAQTVTW